jgi:uncharacterized protein YgbK (DUF1537 family)
MSLRCHILADDLTGGLDSAGMLAGAGTVPVLLEAPRDCGAAATVQVCVSASRDLAPATLPQHLAPCLPWLTRATLPFKKIDSLLRGNTFAELAWLAHSGAFERLVVAPAFPAQGRTVQGGRLHLSAGGDQVDLAGHLRALGAVATGDGACLLGAARLEIPDGRSDAELDALVRAQPAPSGRTLWCGSAGLAAALARVHGLVGAALPLAPVAGEVLLVTGTRHRVLRAQLDRLDVLGWPRGCRFEDLASPGELSPEHAATALADGAARLAAQGPAPARLVVVGGDTLLALCRAARVRTLLAGPAPRPGWGSARLVGGPWDGVHCLSRSGAFGGPGDLRELLASAADPHSQPSETLPT